MAAAQRPGGFRVIGPGGGGAMFHPTISPLDPKTVLVACDMSGAYITHDGGETWRMFNLRGAVRSFAFDPSDPAVMYAVGIGLWRSRDSGATWELLLPHPAKVIGVADANDEADVQILTTDEQAGRNNGFPAISGFTVDPLDPKRLYAAIGSKLWRSKDGGVRWSVDGTLPNPVTHIAVVDKAPGKTQGEPDLWMAGPKGFLSLYGSSVQTVDGPPGIFKDESVEVVGGKVLLTVSAGGKFFQAAVDAADKKPAVHWVELKLPGEGGVVTTFASGHDGQTIYASFSKLMLYGRTWLGVAKSTDAGAHWDLIWKESGKGAPNATDGWLTDAFSSNWGDEPRGLAVSDKDHALIYATDEGRTMKSTDAGGHWNAVYSHRTANGHAVSSGLDVTESYGVHFDPYDAKRMFIGSTDIGLLRSDDGGDSWTTSHDGVPYFWRNTTYWMVFDPAVRGRVWAAMARTHDLPRVRMWRNTSPETFQGGVCVSNDGGVHWSVAGSGMPEAAVTHIVLDPKSPANRRTLYAAAVGRGVFKSVDGGKTWVAKNQGITQHDPLAWRLALAADGTLYVILVRGAEYGKIGDGNDGALYRSRDGAETWERMKLPQDVNGPNGLTIDPRDPSRMYLATWAHEVGPRGAGGGIYGTRDGGATWQLLFGGDPHVYDVTFNPANPSELYATGFSSSAWHSTDNGAHWTRIAGFNYRAAHRVIADPVHPGMVYITTFGGGVWHGAVDGKPGIEDIATRKIAP